MSGAGVDVDRVGEYYNNFGERWCWLDQGSGSRDGVENRGYTSFGA